MLSHSKLFEPSISPPPEPPPPQLFTKLHVAVVPFSVQPVAQFLPVSNGISPDVFHALPTEAPRPNLIVLKVPPVVICALYIAPSELAVPSHRISS
jgi:hypothetical protein